MNQNSPTMTRTSPARVVILGGGFGGLHAAQALRSTAAQITLVDRTNHHLFQPLLYQVATATLAPSDIAVPIRWVLRRQRNVTVLLGEAEHVDTCGHLADRARRDLEVLGVEAQTRRLVVGMNPDAVRVRVSEPGGDTRGAINRPQYRAAPGRPPHPGFPVLQQGQPCHHRARQGDCGLWTPSPDRLRRVDRLALRPHFESRRLPQSCERVVAVGLRLHHVSARDASRYRVDVEATRARAGCASRTTVGHFTPRERQSR